VFCFESSTAEELIDAADAFHDMAEREEEFLL
jgi:uncharacterized LabA/DUF88 family protein